MERKPKSEGGIRAEKLVKTAYSGLSGRQIEEALDRGLVLGPAGERLKKGTRLAAGVALRAEALVAHLARLARGNPALAIDVVGEGDGFVVVDKPAGTPSHPLGLFDDATVTHWALARYPGLAAEFPGAQPTVTPHRLDTGTSGCLVVALTAAAFATWRAAFEAHEVEKTYLAWAWGEPAEDAFVIDAAIAPAPGDSKRRRVADAWEEGARPCRSDVRVLARREGMFLAEVVSRTGVTHQVRVHLASKGHPLVGDRLYDPSADERPARRDWHQLRAVGLSLDGRQYKAPGDLFSAQFC